VHDDSSTSPPDDASRRDRIDRPARRYDGSRDLDLVVETILTRLFATSSGVVADRVARANLEGDARLNELEERRARLEEEIAERAIQLRELREQIGAERARSLNRTGLVEGLREIHRQLESERAAVARGEGGETTRQADDVLATARREADELLTSAQQRASEIERGASERQSTVLAESEALEHQLRDLDARISRLLQGAGQTPSPDPGTTTATALLGSAAAAGPDTQTVEPDESPTGARNATVVFHAVRGFHTALALERALKAMDGVNEVRVLDFDERRLSFRVAHTLDDALATTIQELGNVQLDLLQAEPDRLVFQVRA
jgi:hypothetical protein